MSTSSSTNWKAISNLIGDCWMYLDCTDGYDSAFLYRLLEVLDSYVSQHLIDG